MNYSEQLKHPKWQKKRLEILQRDAWKCKLCGDGKTTLHIHHKQYTAKEIWDEASENLITLCEHCHIEIESIKEECNKLELINIYKSNDWRNRSRIMFVSYNKKLSMRIYDKNNDFVCGFNFVADLKCLKKIISKTLKDGKEIL